MNEIQFEIGSFIIIIAILGAMAFVGVIGTLEKDEDEKQK